MLAANQLNDWNWVLWFEILTSVLVALVVMLLLKKTILK